MKLKEDVVSVILPVHNAGKFLSECLESLSDQTHQSLQIIAIDDFSKDNSYAILKKFKKNLKNLEIYRNKKRYGLAICYNRAMKRAQGKFIAFMNPNDVNTISRFKRQVNFLLKNPKTVAVGSQFTQITEQNKKLEKSALPEENDEIYETLLQPEAVLPETFMINRKLLPKDLLYFKPAKYPLIFTGVFVKLFQYGKVANITQSLYMRREGVKRYGRRSSKVKQIASIMKIWLTSRSEHDYHPSLRSFFPQIVRGL